MQKRKSPLSFLKVAAIIALAVPFCAYAAAMQSASYQIEADSVNIGGGASASPNYSAQDTAGEIATGPSSSANYSLSAGYQSMQDVSISITSPSDIALPAIRGLTGGTSTSTASWTVITDDDAGYSLAAKASTAPAFLGTRGASFADYVPASIPDFAFNLPAASALFGFSPTGLDIAAKYKDDGASCNAGSGDTADACWDGFSTSDKIIAGSNAPNVPSGTATSIEFRAAIGSNKIQDADSYSGTITVTATAL